MESWGLTSNMNKLNKYDLKIINNITPFSIISYEKRRKIDIFVGREDNLKTLTENLIKSIYGDKSYGLVISGPGGCGKSTLFGYFTQIINNQELFLKNYCLLKKEDCIIIPCFIDAPKGEPTTLKYFWTSIIDSLAEEKIEFLEKFALSLIVKCIDVLWENNFKKEEITLILSNLIPDLLNKVKIHRIVDLIDINKIFDFIIIEQDFSRKIYDIISQGWRILQKHEISLKFSHKSTEYIQKRIFKFDKRYFDLLFDILSNDINKSTNAQNIFKGVEGELIKSDSDVINIFNWFTQTWEWIEENPICLLVGVDNIGYLTVNLEEKKDAYYPFIQTILQMRDSLKKCLFVLIGTNEDWRLFDEFTAFYQDYRSQLQGFIINRIDLTRLILSDVLESLSLIMYKFWSKIGEINPDNPLYPFSRAFFAYLYEYFAHDYRSILIFLDRIWTFYKSQVNVTPFEDDPFKMIRFVRIKSKRPALLQISSYSNIIEEIYFSNLIEWEKEQIKDWFENIKSRHIGKKQSELVEKKLKEIFRLLQEKDLPKQIEWVERTPSINVILEKGKKTRYPDVYIKLISSTISEKKRAFEIQVKMYDQDKYVKLNDIESSLELLEHAYTDSLLFIMTGAGLDDKCIEKVKMLNLADRILYSKPLDDEQFKALAFLIAYEKITGKSLTIDVIKEILEILFTQSWEDLVIKIRSIGSFRETRISKEIEIKKKSTLEGFIEVPPIPEAIIDEGKAEIPTGLKKEEKFKDEITEEEKQFNEVILKLSLEDSKDLLKIVYNRYKASLKEINFIMETAINRPDRYKGKVTKDYLKKNVPAHLSDENISENFLRLKNECVKKEVLENELIFKYQGTSIIITEIGNSFSKILKEFI